MSHNTPKLAKSYNWSQPSKDHQPLHNEFKDYAEIAKWFVMQEGTVEHLRRQYRTSSMIVGVSIGEDSVWLEALDAWCLRGTNSQMQPFPNALRMCYFHVGSSIKLLSGYEVARVLSANNDLMTFRLLKSNEQQYIRSMLQTQQAQRG